MKQNNTVEVVNEIVNETVETVQELTLESLEDFKNNVTIYPRVGFVKKQAMVQSVYDNSVVKDEENGVFYVDTIMSKMTFDVNMLSSYTNFYEVYKNQYPYDFLNDIGVFNYVYSQIDIADMALVEEAVEERLMRVETLNSVGACLHRTIKEVVGKIPNAQDVGKLLNKLPKLLDKMDKEKLEIFTRELKNGNVAEYAANKKN
jgi:hypothetical protein